MLCGWTVKDLQVTRQFTENTSLKLVDDQKDNGNPSASAAGTASIRQVTSTWVAGTAIRDYTYLSVEDMGGKLRRILGSFTECD